MIRRTLDVLAASGGLLVLAVPMGMLALLVRHDSPGPALLQLLKFRSMRVEHGGLAVAASDDARVTRIGAVLRDLKIDELPQLINVLCGDMSLVAPRPEVPGYVDLWPDDVRRIILPVRPRLTDPVTVSLRDESRLLTEHENPERYYADTLLPEKARRYAQYLADRTLGGDLKVIAAMVRAII